MNRQQLARAAAVAATRCLRARGSISLPDVFAEMGKLSAAQLDA